MIAIVSVLNDKIKDGSGGAMFVSSTSNDV